MRGGYTNLARACNELTLWLFAIIAGYITSAISLYAGAVLASALSALIATCASLAWLLVAHAYLIFSEIDVEPRKLTGSVVSLPCE